MADNTPRLRIRNWRAFQHYGKRRPPWIKLHFQILSSADWVRASDRERLLAIICMLVASQDDAGDGSFNADSDYFKRLAYLEKAPDFKPLIQLGFLEPLADASNCDQGLALASLSVSVSVSEEEKKIPRIAGSKKRSLSSPDFVRFWTAYPRKDAKQSAERAFARLHPDEAMLAAMLGAVERSSRSEQWLKAGPDGKPGAFIPMAATWLNGRRWEDGGVVLAQQPRQTEAEWYAELTRREKAEAAHA